MKKTKKLVLFGTSAFAEIAYEYFTYDSEYEVCAFTADEAFIDKKELFGLPVVPFDFVEKSYPPAQFDMHIALVYNKLNRIRKEKYFSAKDKGYVLANYISSRSFVWKNVSVGDNVFVFEDNTVQPFVKLGSNLVLWSGNHIGHHSEIKDHIFISSHVVISGFCTIGECCFLGVNSTISNNITIGKDCFLSAGSTVIKDLPDNSFVKCTPGIIDSRSTHDKFGISI